MKARRNVVSGSKTWNSIIVGDAQYLPLYFHYRSMETAVKNAGGNSLPHTIQAALNMNKENKPKYLTEILHSLGSQLNLTPQRKCKHT